MEGAAKLSLHVGDTVTAVAFSDDDKLFAACSTNNKAIVYSTADGTIKAEFKADSAFSALALFDSDGKTHLVGGTFAGLCLIGSSASASRVSVAQYPAASHPETLL